MLNFFLPLRTVISLLGGAITVNQWKKIVLQLLMGAKGNYTF